MGARECRGLRKDGSWGARAWEELDAGTTIRRIEPDDTVVTLSHDASTVEAAVLMWGARPSLKHSASMTAAPAAATVGNLWH